MNRQDATAARRERTEKEDEDLLRGSSWRPPRPGGWLYFAVTTTLTVAVTSETSFTVTGGSPTVLMGSASWIFLRATATPWALRAASMSLLVTEPKSLPSSPALT